ncbi:MAG: flagellin lysine-N-methylase [Clostridia bacterium]|nr:flagellin lysine-N-methylase [Clostridia bacterium]
MKLFAPKYYKSFSCIADRCSHSCCVGWEIDIDGDTLEKYSSLAGEYSDAVRASIDLNGTPHFRLCEGERCPHLDGRGLCNIIKEYGEGYLSEICREHPRFYSETPEGVEVGIGMACEEAARIILSSDGYAEFDVIDGDFGEEPVRLRNEADFDVLSERGKIYRILSDRVRPYAERLALLSEKYGVSPASVSDGDWRELLSSLEYLNQEHKELFSCYSGECRARLFEPELERALAYFIFRHVTASGTLEELSAKLGLAMFLESLISSVAYLQGIESREELTELCRAVSEELEYSEDNTEAILWEFLF